MSRSVALSSLYMETEKRSVALLKVTEIGHYMLVTENNGATYRRKTGKCENKLLCQHHELRNTHQTKSMLLITVS